MEAEAIIKKLNLKPHEMEGGYYRETYKSDDIIDKQALPNRYQKDKAACTAIYFLLTPDTFSVMHRLPTDEIFHFYLGDPIEMLVLKEDKPVEIINLGNDLNTAVPQYVVQKGNWQGSRLKKGGRFGLLGVTVSPAFDFSDFEIGQREDLLKQFPDYEEQIIALTH